MKRKFISILVILILVISALNTVCFAETSADYKQKSQDAKEKLEDVTGEINTALQAVLDVTIDEILVVQREDIVQFAT